MKSPAWIKKIVIVGNHNAAWMTAAALGHVFKGFCSVTVVQPDRDQGAIEAFGACERILPSFSEFLKLAGLSDAEFLAECGAIHDPGTNFLNWNGHGHLSRFFPTLATASHAEVPHSGYILDSSRLLVCLRKAATGQGVERVDTKLFTVEQDGETGFVRALLLDKKRRIEGDLFIDCTGADARIISEIGVGYEDWNHFLPVDTLITAPCQQNRTLPTIPSVMATQAGWQWRIPLHNRVSNGYAFASDYISIRKAAEGFHKSLEATPLMPPKIQKFRSGRRLRSWHKNVIAIGASAGVIEPLEPVGLLLIQSAIERLLRRFPTSAFKPALTETYCRETQADLENVRDFILLKYHKSSCFEGPFWKAVHNLAIPDSLENRLMVMRDIGNSITGPHEMFPWHSWQAVLSDHALGSVLPPPLQHPAQLPKPRRRTVTLESERRTSQSNTTTYI